MKENFTSITVILDKSGSMWSLASDTIGGFNQFLKDQKAAPGEALLTLCTFSHDYNIIHDCKTLAEIPDLDEKGYIPSGGTALLDAMGQTIESVGKKLADMPEEERPAKIIFLIITDGQENASENFKADQIKDMVQHQKDKYNWEFVFMGSNIDSIAEGTAIGISMHNTMNYSATSDGTRGLYQEVSKSMTRYRTRSVSNSTKSKGFFAADDEKEEGSK